MELITTAKIKKSMFNKKMFDVSIYRGREIVEAVICINYREAIQTAKNFNAILKEE